MSRVWSELYPYNDFTGVRLAIDKDYVLQLEEAGGWISVDGIASGGERSMASLALRIAFSLSFIPNLRWLKSKNITSLKNTIYITSYFYY